MLIQHTNQNIFANYAADYAEHGLIVLPVGKEDGKRPLVKHWNKFGLNSWEWLIDKFPDANIGIINGKGKYPICAIDIDEPKLLQDALDYFGKTPVIIRTPSGGYHLWYRYKDEYRKIRFKGQEIDVLGNGGFMVAPPSYRPEVGAYGFIEGDVTDIPHLPYINKIIPANNNQIHNSDIGVRNNQLFHFCKEKANDCSTELELLEIATNYNNQFNPPLTIIEVQKVVLQIWTYKEEGRLLNKGDNKMMINLDLLNLSFHPDAFTLLINLIHNHGARNEPFSIDQEKVKAKLGWGDRRRVTKAIDYLITASKLDRIGKGGPTGRAYQYLLLI